MELQTLIPDLHVDVYPNSSGECKEWFGMTENHVQIEG